MLNPYLENLEIIDVYCQNSFQEIYKCKHKEENAYYLLNLIRDKELFYDIDLKEFVNCFSYVKEIGEVDEGIFIVTEHSSNIYLSEYLKNREMTLSKQINNITYIFDTLIKLRTLSCSFMVSLFNYNNLLVNHNGDINFSGIIEIDEEVINSGEEEVFTAIANTMHMIFTKSEIINRNISKGIPPDIEKIIRGCIEHDYSMIVDLVSDYKATSIYRLINPEREDIKRVTHMRKSMSRKRIIYILKTKGVLIALLLIPLLVWGMSSLLKNFKSDEDTIAKNPLVNTQSNIDTSDGERDDNINLVEDDTTEDSFIEDMVNDKEYLDLFFFEDKIKALNEKRMGKMDYSKYHRGQYSLKVYNDTEEKASYIVGYIDFSDDSFSYVKNRTVNLSLWLNSDMTTDCTVVLKLGSDEKVLAQVAKKAKIKADTWTLHNVEINTKNGEFMKVYINANSNDIIWVDTMDIDILK
ncbi:MAG: hypothetical protein WDA24_10550 [Tissierellales bacterium]